MRALAALVRGELRAGDVAYRYGGEELLVVMPDADLADAGQMAERLRSAVAGAALPHPSGIDGVVTLSVGVAAGDGAAAELLDRSDALLYAAKHSGRNRVAVDGDVIAPPPDRVRARVPALSAGPTVRHLQRLLAVSRAALDETDAVPVLEALAETIRCELRFTTVVANLRDGDRVHAVAVLGDPKRARPCSAPAPLGANGKPCSIRASSAAALPGCRPARSTGATTCRSGRLPRAHRPAPTRGIPRTRSCCPYATTTARCSRSLPSTSRSTAAAPTTRRSSC